MASKKRIEPETAPLKQNPFAALSAKKDEAPPAPPKPPSAEPKPPSTPAWGPGKVVLRRERKGRAGKTATRITGLPEARLDELASQLKKALGCGATVEEADVILLGDVVGRAAEWLRERGAPRVVEGN